MSSVIDKINNALYIYYKSPPFERDDYINNNGVGKFIEFCSKWGFENDDDIMNELEVDAQDCMYFIFYFNNLYMMHANIYFNRFTY